MHATHSSVLTSEQKEKYNQDGFLIINDFISTEICTLLMQRARELIHHYELPTVKTIFSADKQHHAKHLYFLESGDKIRFFFEENAINEKGELINDKLLCINKIGHALHDLDPTFNCFSRMHKIAALVNDLAIQQPLLLQSMYICKQPYIGGEVNCHQDSTYLFTKGQPVTGLWFALEDATLENGCLWAIPGGHHTPLKSRSRRDANNHIVTEMYDATPWPLDRMIPLEVPQGSVILLHGLLPHMSKENKSPHSRHAYSLHIISGQDEYPADNWLQRSPEMSLKGFI